MANIKMLEEKTLLPYKQKEVINSKPTNDVLYFLV